MSALEYVVYAGAMALAYTCCGSLAIVLVYFITIIKVSRPLQYVMYMYMFHDLGPSAHPSTLVVTSSLVFLY